MKRADGGNRCLLRTFLLPVLLLSGSGLCTSETQSLNSPAQGHSVQPLRGDSARMEVKSPDHQRAQSKVSRVPGVVLSALRARIPAFFTILRIVSLRVLILVLSLAVITATILFLLRRGERGRFMTNTRLSIMDKEVQKACRYIEKQYADPEMTLDSICASLVTGSAFLQALFMRELGMSVEEFIAQVRINHARQILEQTDSASAEHLACRVGFSDEKAFLGAFKHITGSDLESYRAAIS